MKVELPDSTALTISNLKELIEGKEVDEILLSEDHLKRYDDILVKSQKGSRLFRGIKLSLKP